MTRYVCPRCDGKGFVLGRQDLWWRCPVCGGDKKVTLPRMKAHGYDYKVLKEEGKLREAW